MPLVLEKNHLPTSGMPVFSCSVPGTQAFVLLASFPAGSIVEKKEGLAHLAEHMLFQGNSHYPNNIDIAKAVEDLGATINASTTHSGVSFFIKGHVDNASKMINLLGRCFDNPYFRERDIQKEKEIVAEEIRSYQQNPSFHFMQKTAEALYGDHPLARPVVGNEESIRSITRDDLISFRDHFWNPKKGGLFLAGNPKGFCYEKADQFFSFREDQKDEKHLPLPKQPQDFFLIEEDEKQSEVCMVWRLSDSILSPEERISLAIYSNILGGTMSSQLFQEMREKRGLCYHASADGLTSAYGSGLIVSFALAPEKLSQAIAVAREIILSKKISQEEFLRAKNSLASHWALSLESSFRVASTMSSWYLNYAEEINPQDFIEKILSIDKKSFMESLDLIKGDPKIVLRGPHGEKSARDYF